MTTAYWTAVDSPLGTLWLTGDGAGLSGLYMGRPAMLDNDGWVEDDAPFTAASHQLAAYFAGELREFDVPLNPSGTPFQQEVWAALRAIPYGETRSYREIAEQIGRPTASRAVGAANGRNPICIVVPCHRVVGSSGVLTGYAWGLDRKRTLLDLETTGSQQRLPAPAVVA
ncbi:methylated-DNA--[protein]-cysteine S-methyltransferase [Jiangella asiatica]|uniref:Methylated-DNA--protein-cysteine methyltransferase n=1 Tax=Jiangella asiatica TaxID=2530372 RepID=A0A4R5D3J4_9ACTN|nr:methylated-DNA--[protein]-cysteine S-methyltransferase [Jiangella asiatica]TDE07932.1 methylated-DNA--[protein]-cysteine S-methyltransferase [Jiangella asiatica]